MAGLDLVNTLIFVGASLVVLGIFSSLIATRFGAPLLLVFLVVGMLAGEDGPGGIVFNNYGVTYLVGLGRARGDPVRRRPADAALGLPRGAGALAAARHRRRAASPRRSPARAAWAVLDLDADRGAAARRDHRLDRRGGGVLPAAHRRPAAAAAGSTRRSRSSRGTNDPIAVFLVIVLTEFILAGARTPGLGARARARRAGRHRRGARRWSAASRWWRC